MTTKNTLCLLIPDVDVILAIPVEELAELVLRLAHEHEEAGLIHLERIASQAYGTPRGTNGYPQNRLDDVRLAIAEAWNWLLVQGLLVPEPGMNGSNGFMVLRKL